MFISSFVLASLSNPTPTCPESKFEPLAVRTAQQLDVTKFVTVVIDITEIRAGIVVEAVVIDIDLHNILLQHP